MLQWISDHQVLLYWLAGISLVMFVATLVFVPLLVARIPPDYFAHRQRPAGARAHRPRAARITLAIAKNTLGYLFILAGIAMPALPGQGTLTFLIGFLLIDFPGKYRLERWLVSRPKVFKAINWFRAGRGRAPLITNGAA